MNFCDLFSGGFGDTLYLLSGSYSSGQFFFLGSEPVTLQFISDGSVTYPGFNVRFYMGEQSPGNKFQMFKTSPYIDAGSCSQTEK